MKKLALALSLAASASMVQAASTGTITFTGELTGTTCDVSVDGQGANATVTLPTIGTNQLTAPGNTAGSTNFLMELTNCSGTLTTVSSFFEAGATVDNVTGRLKNTGGTAGNVTLQLRDGSSATAAVIKAGSASQVNGTTYVAYSGTPGTATLPYMVEYYAEGATTAGTVNSSVVYSLQYK